MQKLTIQPLADRMRPRSLDEVVGQEKLLSEEGILRQMVEAGRLSSFILWGPPGVGKTTLARMVASTCGLATGVSHGAAAAYASSSTVRQSLPSPR